MRSNLITVVTAVASVVLVASVASADQVQEQFRLMEQRMAEMEDRLEATSADLRTARATVDEQQSLLSDAGLVELEEAGLRSSVGSFFESVDVSGVAAASYNHRLIKADDPNGGNALFKNPNANTFQVDQIWLTLDKAPTEESRAGFHAEFATGASATVQGDGGGGDGVPYLYSGYVSYLAPVLDGVQVDPQTRLNHRAARQRSRRPLRPLRGMKCCVKASALRSLSTNSPASVRSRP